MTPDTEQPVVYRVGLSFLIHLRDRGAFLEACSQAEYSAMLGVVPPSELLSADGGMGKVPIPYGIRQLIANLLESGLPGAESLVGEVSVEGPVNPTDPEGEWWRDRLNRNPPDDDQ